MIMLFCVSPVHSIVAIMIIFPISNLHGPCRVKWLLSISIKTVYNCMGHMFSDTQLISANFIVILIVMRQFSFKKIWFQRVVCKMSAILSRLQSVNVMSRPLQTLVSLCHWGCFVQHYSNVIMGAMVSQISGVSIVYSTFCSGALCH